LAGTGEASLAPTKAQQGHVVTLVLASTAGEVIVWIVWVVAALFLVGSGLAVILFTNALFAAIALIVNLAALSVLYLLLSAEFVTAAQVLVYAGAVMVMFLFVIAYIGTDARTPAGAAGAVTGRRIAKLAAIGVGLAIVGEVAAALALDASGGLSTTAEITGAFGSPAEIGRLFLSDHLLAFEVTSIILLVGAIGGVILGSGIRRDRAAETTAADQEAA
jgi:NADH:ubiquinone oxidoreductase subunit 6 (subunit J)